MWLKRQNGSPKSALAQLGKLESEVMERIWARGEISVRELHLELAARLAYTTVMTTLDRLYKKGILQRRKVGKAFYYAPAMTQEDYHRTLTQHLVGMVLEDGADKNIVLSSFVNAVSEADLKLLDDLDQLLKAKRRALRRREQ
jgi:predicted transcriptional regulator